MHMTYEQVPMNDSSIMVESGSQSHELAEADGNRTGKILLGAGITLLLSLATAMAGGALGARPYHAPASPHRRSSRRAAAGRTPGRLAARHSPERAMKPHLIISVYRARRHDTRRRGIGIGSLLADSSAETPGASSLARCCSRIGAASTVPLLITFMRHRRSRHVAAA
jgi:hypothetical protein